MEMHPVAGDDFLVQRVHGADVVETRNILCGYHCDNAWASPDCREIQFANHAMGRWADADVHVQQASGLENVVDIDSAAGDVLDGAVMRQGLLHHPVHHYIPPASRTGISAVHSRKNRCSRFRAASKRYSLLARQSVKGV